MDAEPDRTGGCHPRAWQQAPVVVAGERDRERLEAMVHRELTAGDLDDDLLLELVRLDDPLGVVSVYIDAHRRRAGAIEAKNRLAELERRLATNGNTELADAVPRLLKRIEPTTRRLLEPGGAGHGRALFAPLTHPEIITFSSQLRLPNRVVLDSSAFIHPLLELLARGRPTGVVLVWTDGAELLDWRLGELRRLTQISEDPAAVPRRLRPGTMVTGGPRARQITPLREQREHERRARLLGSVAAEIERLADARVWERLLITGQERLTAPVVAALSAPLRQITLRDPRQLDELDPAKLTAAVAECLAADHEVRGRRLALRMRDAALGAGRGALGLSEVAAALNEARAEHVVYDPSVRYTGAVADDGTLYGGSEGTATAVAEPRLTERIVERALHTGARLTPVEGAAQDVLREAEGIAALLRW
jgi:hypothetical protein